jgi:hypothetical protein
MMRWMLAAAVMAVFLCPRSAAAQAVFSSVRTAAPTATVFTSVLSASNTRSSCVVTNIGTTQGLCQAKAAGITVSTSNAIPVPANGGQFLCGVAGAGVIIQDEIDCTCASGTCAFVINATGQ